MKISSLLASRFSSLSVKLSLLLAVPLRAAFLLLSTAAAALLLVPPAAQAAPFTFGYTGSLNTGRAQHTASLLPNGKVLVAGGQGISNRPTSTELYNPASGTWTVTGSLHSARVNHTATLLSNGMVLVAGGYGISSNPLTSAELYDPASGTWTATGSLHSARYSHTARLLPNGMVLVAGGYNNSVVLSSAELYDPASGTWAATGSLNTARYNLPATLLPNGMVLVAGGFGISGPITSAELYDPASGTWTATGSLNTARQVHTASLLPNGMVLVAGGAGTITGSILSSAELYDSNPYSAQVQQPINADGSSVFNVHRGVVPVKFTLTLDGTATCDLPPATIALTRTAGGTLGEIDEFVYAGAADTGSNFRIDSCQYIYNLSANALGVGTYRIDVMINGQVVGSATFVLR